LGIMKKLLGIVVMGLLCSGCVVRVIHLKMND